MVREAPENPWLRRQRLLVRSAELRITIAGQSEVLKAPLALADQVRAGIQWLYRHPEWPLAGLVALAVLRPQRTLRWAGRLWWAWTSLRRAQSWLAAVPLQRL
jgi:hypothetical protein